MSSVLTQAIGDILDNYADAIEGGNSHRGSGTAHKGICGMETHHELDGTTLTADTQTNTTTVDADDLSAADAAKLVRANTPPWFLLCLTQASGSGNTGAARKITTYASDLYTVAPAFPETVQAEDTFELREGFKRAPDKADLEGDKGTSGGFDRFFQLSMLPGKRAHWYGNSTHTYETTLEIRLRLLNRGRKKLAIDSALENLMVIRSVLDRPDIRSGDSYTQLVEAESTEPRVLIDDGIKVVALDQYRLRYRITSLYL